MILLQPEIWGRIFKFLLATILFFFIFMCNAIPTQALGTSPLAARESSNKKIPSYFSDTPPGLNMPVETDFHGFHSRNVPEMILIPRPHLNMDDLNHPKKDPHKKLSNDKYKIVNFAAKFLGIPYRWGGSDPSGFDCSGFAMYVYAHFGQALPHSARAQFHHSGLVAVKKLQPGDLLFFKINKKSIGHVGIYAGEHKFLHSPRTGRTVEFANLKLSYWKSRLAGARRMRLHTAKISYQNN